MKSCSTCVFFDAPKAGEACGICQYPVPEYLRIGGCPYIGLPDYNGKNCAVHKSRAELIEAAKEGVSGRRKCGERRQHEAPLDYG